MSICQAGWSRRNVLVMVDFNRGQHIFCLFAFSFPFPVSMGHVGFSPLVNRGFQVFGQFQDLYQADELLHRNRIIVDAKGCKENANVLFGVAAFIVHRILQTLLCIQCRRMDARSGRIILMSVPNIPKNHFQIIRNDMTKILVSVKRT